MCILCKILCRFTIMYLHVKSKFEVWGEGGNCISADKRCFQSIDFSRKVKQVQIH